MRAIYFLISAVMLTGCDNTTPKSAEQVELEARVAKERAARAEVQEQWEALIRKGQGCHGRILKDQELQQTVSGKTYGAAKIPGVLYPPDFPRVERTYRADGLMFLRTHNYHDPGRKWWVEGEKLCHGLVDDKLCHRLIQAPDGRLMEEALDDRKPGLLALACRPIELEDLRAT